ncbi:MAG TPA: hypothetical protein PKC18_08455 [Lacipirellulaceae bacterium]|nr:hypothetical protein [Lacipirellulaceae bacterium]HMP06827.1 hypothetical protein [Lacipirellulaceae bacterium]
MSANHLGHVAARLSTLAAGFRAGRHVRVVRMLFASFRTPVATDRATFARRACQGTLTRRQGRGQLTTLSAVRTKLSRFCVFLLGVGKQRQAVLETRVALQLAGRAHLSALHEMGGVSAPACLSLRCGGESERGGKQ